MLIQHKPCWEGMRSRRAATAGPNRPVAINRTVSKGWSTVVAHAFDKRRGKKVSKRGELDSCQSILTMPRVTCKRKRTASNNEPLTDDSTAMDGSTARRNEGRPNNASSSGEPSVRSGSSTEARNDRDGHRATSNSTGGAGSVAGSSGSAGQTESSVVNNGSRDSGSSVGRQPPAPLTTDDIPALVREITRQLRPDNTEVQPPLVPGTSRLCVTAGGFPLRSPKGSSNS